MIKYTYVLAAFALAGCAATEPPKVSTAMSAPVAEERVAVPATATPPAALPPNAFAATRRANLELHFVDVDQGDATLIVCPNGNRIMVDTGMLPPTPDRVERAREYIFRNLPGNRLSHLVVTHGDRDHYDLIARLYETTRIDAITLGGELSHYGSDGFEPWLERKRAQGTRVIQPAESYFDRPNRPNTNFDCGEASVYILAANITATASVKNAQSVVLKISYGDFDAILTGDATVDTEEAIMGRYNSSWLDVELLKMGHHGSLATSTSQEWADTVKPEISIASAGTANTYGHPRREVISRLEPYADETERPHRLKMWRSTSSPMTLSAYTKAIFSTASSGDVLVVTNGEDYSIRVDNE